MTSGVIQMLLADAAVVALVGDNSTQQKPKIFPVAARQGEKSSYITVFKSSNDPVTSLDKDDESLLDYPRITVSCWDLVFRKTEKMYEAVRVALDNKKDVDINVTVVDGANSDTILYHFDRVWLVSDRDGYDPSTDLFVHVSEYAVEVKR